MTRYLNPDRRQFLATSAALAASAAIPRLARSAAANLLTDLSAVQAVAAIRGGDLRAEDYARALLDRCEQLKDLNAFISLNPDAVLEAARNADQRRTQGAPLGALFGLPVPLKDSICTTALPTTSGTRSLRDFHPATDAAVWQRLSQADAILLGKTNLHEMSMGWTSTNAVFGPVRNPYDPSRIPGGSSEGTAAAVAAHMAPAGVGEDTNGSIRVPAAMCGIAGLRPTHGRYPGSGVVPLAPILDTVGPMARAVSDLCLFDAVVTGEAMVTAPANLRGMRLGVSRQHYFTDLDSGVERVVREALARVRDAGVTIVEADIPNLAELVGKVTVPIVYYQARRSVSHFLIEQGAPVTYTQLVDELSPDIRKVVDMWVLEGSPNAITEQAYQDAIQIYRPALQRTWRNYFREHRLAAVIAPVVRMPAPLIPSPPGPAGSDRDLLALGLAMEQVLERIPSPQI